ncbi:hypothetical protein BDW68DRAFT_186084 [Aspergillus falconensis]
MEHLQPREYEASRLVLGDEIEALTQQLEEIRYYRENDKGKRRADDLPDSELGISASLDEVTTSLGILGDLKFAQCLAQEEFRAEEDRRLASRYSIDDPPLESFSEFDDDTGCDYSIFQRLCYSRQEVAMRRLPELERSCACYISFSLHKIQCLECAHLYYHRCLKSLFMRATADESLFPPRCCGKFKSAEVEFSSTERTYCSNTDCGNASHNKDYCAAATELQATLALAEYMRCCNCGAQFFRGSKWKTCNCPQFEEMRLYATQEAVVEADTNSPRLDVAPEDDLGDNRAQCRHNR